MRVHFFVLKVIYLRHGKRLGITALPLYFGRVCSWRGVGEVGVEVKIETR
jgi:hypothetical protein